MEPLLRKSSMRFMKRKESTMLPSYFNEAVPSFETLRAILELQHAQRSKEMVDVLVSFTKHLKFFADITSDNTDEAHFQCCQHLTYAYCPAGAVTPTQFLFRQGDSASQFYIILSGSCSVLSQLTPHSELRLLSILRQGDSFGELALISHMPRAASVMSREDCHFAVLERSDYSRILAKIQDKKLNEKVELLLRHPVFAKWQKTDVQKISYFFKVVNYKRKQVVFAQGTNVEGVVIIKSGEFRLTKEVAMDSCNGKTVKTQVDITVVSAGEFLGGQAALQSSLWEYTAVCSSTQGEVMIISKDDFTRMMSSDDSINYFLRLTGEKEKYRKERLAAAVEVEQAKRNALQRKPKVLSLLPAFNDNLLQDLRRERSAVNSPSPCSPLPDLPKSSSTLRLSTGIGTAHSQLPETGSLKGKWGFTRSWGDIVLHKYSLSRPKQKRSARASADSSPVVQRKGVLKPLHFHSGSFDYWRTSVFALDAKHSAACGQTPGPRAVQEDCPLRSD